jgi:hypothetical protein
LVVSRFLRSALLFMVLLADEEVVLLALSVGDLRRLALCLEMYGVDARSVAEYEAEVAWLLGMARLLRSFGEEERW